MNLEQRLQQALQVADTFEPSPDLFARVERSLAEDRAHRRRLVAYASATLFGMIAAILFVGAFVTRSSAATGLLVPRWTMEVVEALVLVAITVSLGPSIRRFGRNYVDDMFRMGAGTGTRMLDLLDMAYYLIFGGIILVSVSLTNSGAAIPLQMGLHETSDRFATFLLVMGLLHAATLAVLPVVGAIFSSNTWRAHRHDLGPEAPSPSPDATRAEAIVKSGVILIVVAAIGGIIFLLTSGTGMLLG